MEQKNLKVSVFSLDTMFCESVEQSVDVDFMLPDYYADISKVLKCNLVPRISSKSISGNRISIEGCITITVIYCGIDNCISSYEYQYPFSKSIDTDVDTSGGILTVKTKCEYVNCRAVTNRKIDVHGAVGVSIELSKRKTTDVISDCDDNNIELLRGSIPATMPLGCAEKYLFVEEEFEIGSGQPDIRCIVRYDAEANITEDKIMAGKSVVKGEMIVRLLYSANDGTTQTVRYQLPFSQIIELDGATDECDCESKVSVAQLEIKPRASITGECRQFSLNAKLLVTSECCCNNDVEVILDAYSRKYEADVCKNDICFSKICDNINQNFICKKTFEFADGALSSIADIWCETRTDTIKFDDNIMRICGAVTTFIVALDCDKIPVFYEKVMDFEFSHPVTIEGDLKCLPQITIAGVNYTLTGNCDIEIRVDLNVCAAIYKCSKLPLITDIVINDTRQIAKDSVAMKIYYASKGEKLWDIARRYLADLDEIKQINELDDDELNDDKMILVPNS